jgi:Ala-tRNA(Pro) deacylase
MMPIQKLKKFLDDNRIKYVSIKHSLAYTAQEIAASTHISGRNMAKTVIIKLDGKMAMAVLPAPCRVDTKLLKKETGAKKVEIATEQEFTNLFPECDVGAMPPFGNLYNMDVYVDRKLIEDEEIAFNAGSHTELIKMAYKDFERLVRPKVVSLSAQ